MQLPIRGPTSWKPALLFVGLFAFSVFFADIAQACHVKFGQQLKLSPVLTGGEDMTGGVVTTGANPSDTISITMSDANVQICPSGAATPMWTMGGDFPPPTIRRTTNPDTNNQGPTKLKFVNNLSEITDNQGSGDNVQGLGGGTQTGVPGNHSEISVHHHGSHVTPQGDGWACGYYIRSTNDGSSSLATDRTYTFFLRENDVANTTGGERGTTEWYHNHRVDVTGHTAWRGLAGGMFIIDDPADPTLPKGPAVTEGGVNKGFKYDVSLVLRDLEISNSNSNHNSPYRFDAQGSTGNHILVNGIPQPNLNVDRTTYLFRVLVPGNARKYFMRLRRTNSNSNVNMVQVMQDAGIVSPVSRTIIPIGIAERVGFIVDFGKFSSGDRLILQNVQSTSDGGDCVPGNCTTATSEIMRFTVGSTTAANVNVNAITRRVPNNNRNSSRYIGDSVKNRAFRFTSEGQPFWTIVREDLDDSDRIMDCRRYDADPTVNTVEQWTIHGVGNWTHSIHIHDVDQICVSRNGSSCPASDLFKEVWPIAPGTTFVVKLKPTDFTQASANAGDNDACTTSSAPPNNVASTSGDCANTSFGTTGSNETIPTDTPNYHGTPQPDVFDAANGEDAGGRYMMHCHVLEHEDTAMMTQWRVKSVSNNGNTKSEEPCSTPGGCSP